MSPVDRKLLQLQAVHDQRMEIAKRWFDMESVEVIGLMVEACKEDRDGFRACLVTMPERAVRCLQALAMLGMSEVCLRVSDERRGQECS